MGALSGSISVRRYQVTDPLPDDPRAKLCRGAKAHGFAPLDPKGEEVRAVGWVALADQNDAELRADKLLFVGSGGEQLRLSLRIDELKPPPAEVRRQLKLRVAALEEERGRPLTRGEKGAVKEEIVRALRQTTLPRVKIIDLVWNLDTGRLYFWSQTKGINELFLDLFVRSFGLRLEVDGPTRWARQSKPAAKLVPTTELWRGFTGLRPLGAAEENR